MPQDTTLSLEPPLISFNSKSSVNWYQTRLKPKLETVTNRETTLQELVDTAQKLVNEALASNAQNIVTYRKGETQASVQLDQIMLAMLATAEECGGERSKRYVAASICSCSEEEDWVGALAALGATWLTHFLFVFKTGSCVVDYGYRSAESFARDVLKRDGYKCVLTSFKDFRRHWHAGLGEPYMVSAAHILRRAVGEFNHDPDSDSYKSTVTTFDILANFTRLPVTTLEELCANLDHPSNGISIEAFSHAAFDEYHWCLKPTKVKNVYTVKVFREDLIRKKPPDNRDSFEGFSCDVSGSARSSDLAIDLPDHRYIAIHAALAEILNKSGAGRFFDKLLSDIEGANSYAVRCWSDLERLMEEVLLREAIYRAFDEVAAQ